MKSFFLSILRTHNLDKHDGRSLWQYNLSKSEFEELAETIKTNLSDFRKGASEYQYPIDLTLYFSEFWRQKYDGSKKISKELIADSLNIEESKKKLLFEIASEGAKRLNLNWINVRVYDLKLRTILSQGGIPLNFLKKDKNSFSAFIKRIIQSEVSSVEELKNYPEITNLLPASFRNEFIYDSSFKIIEDVLNENIDVLQDTEENLKNLIKVIKQEGTKKAQKKASETIKLSWLLKGESKLDLFCLIDLPNKLKLDDNSNKVLHLNCGDAFVAKYKRNQHGDYLLIGNKIKEIPIEEEQDTQFYLDGNVNLLSIKNENRPYFDKPTLWVKEDNILQYVNSNSTKSDCAEVLIPDNWKIKNENEFSTQKIEINNLTFRKVSFSEQIELEEEEQSNRIKLYTNLDSEHSISFVTQSPEWFNYSQYRIFSKIPEIQIYDSENKKINSGFEKSYRFIGDSDYVKSISVKKLGLYELKVVLEDATEIFEYFYLIDSFNINSKIISEDQGEFEITNKDNFYLKFNSSENTKIETNGNGVKITNTNLKIRPKYIKAYIKTENQSKGCNIYLNPPFNGIYLIDNNSTISDESIPLLLNNTKGYRLQIPIDKSKKYFARISNINYPGIKSDIRLNYGSNDLLKIQDDVSKLILLSSLSSGIPKVKMDIYEESIRDADKKKRKSTYYFKRYNAVYSKVKEENTISSFVKLYLIPFNVSDELLLPYELTFDESDFSYSVSNLPEEIKEFCIVSDDINYFILPKYINYESIADLKFYLNKEVIDLSDSKSERPYSLNERLARIENISTKLTESPFFMEGSEWSILKKYIDLSLDFKLPFNTFDHINAIGTDYNLYAKFIFNILNSEKSIDELINVIQKIEDNLGVSLLWVPIKTWIDLFSEDNIAINRFFQLMSGFYSYNKYAIEIVNFIFNQSDDLLKEKETIDINNILVELRNLVTNLREELGESINDLPKTYPVIQSCFRNSMPIEKNEHKGLTTIKLVPLAVALSLTCNSTRIWKESVENSKENTEFVKRIILYISNLHPDWYYKTIYNYIKKIRNEF